MMKTILLILITLVTLINLPSVIEFIKEDNCIDSGAVWDETTKTCKCEEENYIWYEGMCVTEEHADCYEAGDKWSYVRNKCE